MLRLQKVSHKKKEENHRILKVIFYINRCDMVSKSITPKGYWNFSRCAKYSPIITSNVPMYVYEDMGSLSKNEA